MDVASLVSTQVVRLFGNLVRSGSSSLRNIPMPTNTCARVPIVLGTAFVYVSLEEDWGRCMHFRVIFPVGMCSFGVL